MVRLKHRYLLINILYPSPQKERATDTLPSLLQFRRPTPAQLTSQLLLQAVRESVVALYGDYGGGAVGSTLSSKCGSLLASCVYLVEIIGTLLGCLGPSLDDFTFDCCFGVLSFLTPSAFRCLNAARQSLRA
jgi:hypothetical protein